MTEDTPSPTEQNDVISKCVDTDEKSESQNDLKSSSPEEAETEALVKAEELYHDDKLLQAARTLTSANIDKSNPKLKPVHLTIIRKATIGEKLTKKLKSRVQDTAITINDKDENDENGHANPTTENQWIYQGMVKAPKTIQPATKSAIYYKLQPNAEDAMKTKFLVRIETPIDPSFLTPFLSVLNETQLYASWLPNWSTPVRVRIERVTKLHQIGRVSQVVAVKTAMPWPMGEREVVLRATAWDDIDEKGDIGLHLRGITDDSASVLDYDEEENKAFDDDGVVIPEVEPGVSRVPWEGGFLFRKCPSDHPALGKDDDGGAENADVDDTEKSDEDKVLVSFTMTLVPRLKYIPQFVLNFIVRVVLGVMWNKLLQVTQDVKIGDRPAHAKAIEEKRESLYDWVDERIASMLSFSFSM